MNDSLCEISVIAPAYNEAGCLPDLVREINAALEPTGKGYEILLVDDGSTDRTAGIIRSLMRDNARVRGCFHAFNCGQSAALATGFREACGEILVTLDADLQNPPSEIPRLLDLMADDVDAVCGVRSRRQDTSLRRLASRLANAYRDRITGVPVRDAGCNFRVLRREALSEMVVFNGMHRFITTILKLQQQKVLEVEIAHEPRFAGQSKYGIGNRLWRGIADCKAIRWYRKRCFPLHRT